MIDTGRRVAPDAVAYARARTSRRPGACRQSLPSAGAGMMIAVPWPERLALPTPAHGIQGGSHGYGSHEHSTTLSAALVGRGVSQSLGGSLRWPGIESGVRSAGRPG